MVGKDKSGKNSLKEEDIPIEYLLAHYGTKVISKYVLNCVVNSCTVLYCMHRLSVNTQSESRKSTIEIFIVNNAIFHFIGR